MSSLKHRILYYASDAPRVIHIFLVAVLMGFSFALVINPETFTLPFFAAFEPIASQPKWAYALALISMFGLTGLMTHSRLWMTLSLFTLSTTYGVLALIFFRGSPEGQKITSGTITYGFIAWLGYYLFWYRVFR